MVKKKGCVRYAYIYLACVSMCACRYDIPLLCFTHRATKQPPLSPLARIISDEHQRKESPYGVVVMRRRGGRGGVLQNLAHPIAGMAKKSVTCVGKVQPCIHSCGLKKVGSGVARVADSHPRILLWCALTLCNCLSNMLGQAPHPRVCVLGWAPSYILLVSVLHVLLLVDVVARASTARRASAWSPRRA